MRKAILLIIITQFLANCSSGKINSRFEKMIFHTSKCFGTCPEYHLELNQNKKIKLYIEKAYQNYKIDSTRIGFYRGKLDKETYNEFLSILEKIDLEKSGTKAPPVEPNTITLSEGSQLTLILYIDNKRKPMRYIYPAGLMQDLMAFLYKISKDKSLTKVNEKLEIESLN
ncbi:hypothetical protein FEDK69T_30880 [Flavobacterium enshiense DK69]|uniref:DUF6438 domain-containing protein n=1 Tax=Flavobacterium enshiense DK69 TaxID=1107311 RepID=V6S0N8_9FLAO|nr:DUF6438 domain-containing protein [Flavobacterium enshiense]ESU19832.1 hypothetical protein FEDK69T_30880 [Flavobacterium enshiense DK69]KGO93127.1 hypothetical protein Q767_15230 [Flavobacterium enshiense DK69]